MTTELRHGEPFNRYASTASNLMGGRTQVFFTKETVCDVLEPVEANLCLAKRRLAHRLMMSMIHPTSANGAAPSPAHRREMLEAFRFHHWQETKIGSVLSAGTESAYDQMPELVQRANDVLRGVGYEAPNAHYADIFLDVPEIKASIDAEYVETDPLVVLATNVAASLSEEQLTHGLPITRDQISMFIEMYRIFAARKAATRKGGEKR